MPTFTGSIVSVTTNTLSTGLHLAEIRDLLSKQPPNHSNRAPGWRSTDDNNSGIGSRGIAPTAGPPMILPTDGDFPERLAARYYWWRYDPTDGLPDDHPDQWILEAVDVFISGTPGSYLVLWSSHNGSLVEPAGGKVSEALVEVLKRKDNKAVLKSSSVLNLEKDDIYLWLTQQAETGAELATDISVHVVAGISAEEDIRRSRSGVLRGDVDLSRISFLSAVAERSKLGPALVTFSERDSKGRKERVSARVWLDGDFKLLMSNTIYRELASGDQERLESVQRLAYRYLPLAKAAYKADKAWSSKSREWLVLEKQVELAKHYQELAEANPHWAEFVSRSKTP